MYNMSVPPLYMTESSFQIRFVMVLAIRSLLKQCGPVVFRLPSKTRAPNSLRMPLVHVAVGHGVAPRWFQVECDGRMCTIPHCCQGLFWKQLQYMRPMLEGVCCRLPLQLHSTSFSGSISLLQTATCHAFVALSVFYFIFYGGQF